MFTPLKNNYYLDSLNPSNLNALSIIIDDTLVSLKNDGAINTTIIWEASVAIAAPYPPNIGISK